MTRGSSSGAGGRSVLTGTRFSSTPICLLHIGDTQPLLYLQLYSHAVVSRWCRGRGKVWGRICTLLVAILSQNVAYLRPSRLSPSFPLYRHTSAASPASMTSSTVASFLQNCSALSLNNALEVNLFSDNPFLSPYSLDVVALFNIASMNRMLLQMSAPNSLWVTLVSQVRFFFAVPRVEHCMNKSKPSGSA